MRATVHATIVPKPFASTYLWLNIFRMVLGKNHSDLKGLRDTREEGPGWKIQSSWSCRLRASSHGAGAEGERPRCRLGLVPRATIG